MQKQVRQKFKENMQQRQLKHRSMTMIITLAIITVDTIMHNQVSIVINVIIIIITIISSKNMLAKSFFILIAIATNSIKIIILSSSQSQPSPP
jgi:hypothetical protein